MITHSVKKTDPNEASNLAPYLAKDLLPEVRMEDKTCAQIASLTQARDAMVKLRTALKNKINNIFSAHGTDTARKMIAAYNDLIAGKTTASALGVDPKIAGVMVQVSERVAKISAAGFLGPPRESGSDLDVRLLAGCGPYARLASNQRREGLHYLSAAQR